MPKIEGFEGSIIDYDINYNTIKSCKYSNGILQKNAHSSIINSNNLNISKYINSKSDLKLNHYNKSSSITPMSSCGSPIVYWYNFIPTGLASNCIITIYETTYTNSATGCITRLEYTYIGHTCPYLESGESSSEDSGSGSGEDGDYELYGGLIVPVSGPDVPINLAVRLQCFDQITDNENTLYSVTLHVDKPNHLLDVGHAYLTLQKSNGSQMQRLSFGFYPHSDNAFLIGMSNPITSAMGEESQVDERVSDIRFHLSVNQVTFQNVISTAIGLASESYDLNDFNCSNYAIEAFNQIIRPPNQHLDATGFKTPNGLYKTLKEMEDASIGNISSDKTNGLGQVPSSTNCNP